MNNTLLAGYAKIDITPPMGIDVRGYFVERLADGVLDELEACALALRLGDKAAIMITLDLCSIPTDYALLCRRAIADKTGIQADAIFIHSTHTHTGPELAIENEDGMIAARPELVEEYKNTLLSRVVKAARDAVCDFKPARMGVGEGKAENIAFIRRFRMRDGSTMTNPGVNNPDILHPIGDIDERVNVVRLDRECDSIALVNFACHPDVVGGSKISADWPGFTRRFFERAVENTKCLFFNGAQGDVNHVNVHPSAGDFNDLFEDFDGCSRGYGHARHMGRVVAGAVMQVWDKVEYVTPDALRFVQKSVDVPSNMPSPEDMPRAREYSALHHARRDSEIPFDAMMLTTVVAEAERMLRLENGPEKFSLLLSALAIGDVVFLGIPGEPFGAVGRGIKETDGWRMICPCCLTNGSEGYFPMMDSYIEGGYEARSSNFRAGVAEIIIDESKKILENL